MEDSVLNIKDTYNKVIEVRRVLHIVMNRDKPYSMWHRTNYRTYSCGWCKGKIYIHTTTR